ncbi:MAG: transposase [Fluviicola sp.]|nr:transposase [Fluviicola sp.]
MSNNLYLGKYRNESFRKPFWDYRIDGAYFITICTKDNEHFFGEINEDKMNLSPMGVIAYILWQEIKNHTVNCRLGEFVVMPNHIHGILILENNGPSTDALSKSEFMAQISPKSTSISTIIRSYKSAVTKYANRLNYPFAWHKLFYDHVIRTNEAFERISKYIENNPKNWQRDSKRKN